MDSDYQRRVRESRGILQRIVQYVPFYHGYKEKELRREADKLLRTRIHEELEKAKAELKEARNYLMSAESLTVFDSADSLVTLCDTISQRINRAPLGYAGFFDSVKVDEPELDRLYERDLQLLQQAIQLTSVCNDFSSKISELTHEQATVEIQIVGKSLKALNSAIDERSAAIRGVL